MTSTPCALDRDSMLLVTLLMLGRGLDTLYVVICYMPLTLPKLLYGKQRVLWEVIAGALSSYRLLALCTERQLEVQRRVYEGM